MTTLTNNTPIKLFLLLMTFTTAAQAKHLQMAPFSTQPLHLISKETSSAVTSEKLKHNVMFLLDDSGSIEWFIGPGIEHVECPSPVVSAHCRHNEKWWGYYEPEGQTKKVTYVLKGHWVARTNPQNTKRVEALKTSLSGVLKKHGGASSEIIDWNTGRYGNYHYDATKDKFKWNVHTLNSITASPEFYDASTALKNIHKFKAVIGAETPITHHFVKAMSQLMESLEYRCQKSYLVLVSDGDASGPNGPKDESCKGQNAQPRGVGGRGGPLILVIKIPVE